MMAQSKSNSHGKHCGKNKLCGAVRKYIKGAYRRKQIPSVRAERHRNKKSKCRAEHIYRRKKPGKNNSCRKKPSYTAAASVKQNRQKVCAYKQKSHQYITGAHVPRGKQGTKSD